MICTNYVMNSQLIQKLQKDSNLTKSSKLLFIKIYEFYISCKSKEVYLSQNRLSELTSISVRTIRDATKLLVKFGYLSVKKCLDTFTYIYTPLIEKYCFFVRTGNSRRQYRSNTIHINTNNKDNRKKLNTKKETTCKQGESLVTEQEEKDLLEKLPDKLRNSMLSIKKSMRENSKNKKNQQLQSPNIDKSSYTSDSKTISYKTTNSTTKKESACNQTTELKTKYHSRELDISFREEQQIIRIAKYYCEREKDKRCDGDVEELTYRLKVKAREEMRTGKARSLQHSLNMSRELLNNQEIGRYYGTKDEQTLHAEKIYAEHEQRKADDIKNCKNVLKSLGVTI